MTENTGSTSGVIPANAGISVSDNSETWQTKAIDRIENHFGLLEKFSPEPQNFKSMMFMLLGTWTKLLLYFDEPFVVSLSNHQETLRQAQGERKGIDN